MAAQEDPYKSFGTTEYFRNKDEQRRVVNDMRRDERNKRIMQQGLTRNIKKAIRKKADPSGFINAAKELGLDPTGGANIKGEGGSGFGQEASQRDAGLRARAAALFESQATQNAKADASLNKTSPASVDANATRGMVSPAPAVNNQPTNVPVTNAQGQVVPSLPFVGPPSPVVESAEPTWWKDVENDRTFKPFSPNDPRFAGKTREEARKEIMSQKAKNLMDRADFTGRQNLQKLQNEREQQYISYYDQVSEINSKKALEEALVKERWDKIAEATSPQAIAENKKVMQFAKDSIEYAQNNIETADDVAYSTQELIRMSGENPVLKRAESSSVEERFGDVLETIDPKNLEKSRKKLAPKFAKERAASEELSKQKSAKLDQDLAIRQQDLKDQENRIRSQNQDIFDNSTQGRIYKALDQNVRDIFETPVQETSEFGRKVIDSTKQFFDRTTMMQQNKEKISSYQKLITDVEYSIGGFSGIPNSPFNLFS
jgi:hypothetical protein